MKKRIIFGTFTLFAALAATGAFLMLAAADDAPANTMTAEQILKKAEEINFGYKDQYMKDKMTIKAKDGSIRERLFDLYQKGNETRLIRFLSPGEVKGMSILIKDHSNIYVYLPDMKKIRKVAANNMSQGVAGSDFTNDDMAQTSWTRDYSPTIEKEDAESWTLRCLPKPSFKSEFTSVLIKVEKKENRITEFHYFKGDKEIKQMVMTELKEFHPGAKIFSKVTLTNHVTGGVSEIELLDFKVNQGLKDDMFTERYLQWGTGN